uniref:Protein kinase domain-containing protein n=2 Tax=Anisakis simplex TaxID=6269 RepID=A0A0M3J813_ANISI
LRSAIAEKKKKQKKAKGLFSTLGRKEDRDNKNKVFVPSTTIPSTNPVAQTSEQDATCLITKDQVSYSSLLSNKPDYWFGRIYRIKLMERLGEGSFAIVKRAIWTRSDGTKVDVAVKILRDATAEVIEDLQTEVNNMQKLQHPYLIRLYGIVFSNPAMMVIFRCVRPILLLFDFIR